MTAISSLIASIVDQAIEKNLINPQDRIYARNQILGLMNESEFDETAPTKNAEIPDILEELADIAVEKGYIENLLDDREILTAKIMDVFLSKPSEINQEFYQKYELSPKLATDYFYQLSKDSNYIQTKRIAKNIHFKADTKYGKLDITINLSKPEKDPEQIKREKERKQDGNYPSCLLCVENEGYVGRIGHPARSNHRVIHVPLAGEDWFLQYSPYLYYNEHSIVFSKEHRPMTINRDTFERITAFTDKFPHYFIGSNADLPIVGGSILSHDHYQAGNYTFAMTNAEDEFTFTLDNYPDVKASIVKWPLSVIRLRSKERKKIVDAADLILEKWRSYTDTDADILAYTNDTPHNTITPIARKRGVDYELDLVLRNNRTTDEHPLGIFHPHDDVHHIKKENIGLIEVMGLAVLPPRLQTELAAIEQFLLGEKVEVADYHKEWVQHIQKKYSNLQSENVSDIIQQELGIKFARILEDAGVYKTDESGRKAFKRFISFINQV